MNSNIIQTLHKTLTVVQYAHTETDNLLNPGFDDPCNASITL